MLSYTMSDLRGTIMTFVLTRELQQNTWKVCRATLHKMRKQNILIEGIHYSRSSNKIYWNTEMIEHGLANGFESLPHVQQCMKYRRQVS